jgi:hypothetical protein
MHRKLMNEDDVVSNIPNKEFGKYGMQLPPAL